MTYGSLLVLIPRLISPISRFILAMVSPSSLAYMWHSWTFLGRCQYLFYSKATSFVAPGMATCVVHYIKIKSNQGWRAAYIKSIHVSCHIYPGMASSLRAGRRTWSSPCSSPLPCWRTKKQQFQVRCVSFLTTLHFVLSCERLSLPTIQKNRSMT